MGKWLWLTTTLLLMAVSVSSCNDTQKTTRSEQDLKLSGGGRLSLPQVKPVQLDDESLKIIATTSIIGDVVANVGGGEVELVTLMAPEQDPHAYEPGAGELTAVAKADVIFVNGWDLEEALAEDLVTIAGETPVVAVGANIDPIIPGVGSQDAGTPLDDDHDHAQVDPHTWFSVPNVKQWVENIVQILSDLDPVNATTYEKNAQSYLLELDEVDRYIGKQVRAIPNDKRVLVTNHGVFNYFAQEYGFQIVGTVIPANSTQAEPSAGDLADLIKDMEKSGVCTIFTDIAADDNLAQTVAAELSGCEEVIIIPLYTGSLGPQGSGADSYIGMLRLNVDRIVEGLQ